jgi:hypothetical protein
MGMLLVAAASFALYLRTLAPTVDTIFDDSLEFQLVPYIMGIAHPTGYPLYTLLAKVFTFLPVGDIAYRINLMSAFFAAAGVAFLFKLVVAQSAGHPGAALGGGLCAAAALVVSPVFWSQATIAEVYALNALFVILILGAIYRLRSPSTVNLPAHVCLLTFLFGLGLTHHRMTILLAPAALLALWQCYREGSLKLSWPLAGKALGFFILPLLLYAYLPLRGAAGSLDGAYVNTLAGFWQHVTAGGYGVFLFGNPFNTDRNLFWYGRLFLEQFGWLGLAMALSGIWSMRRKASFGVQILAFAACLLFPLLYRVADVEVFFIPAFIIGASWIGFGVSDLLDEVLSSGRKSGILFSIAVVAAALLQSGWIGAQAYPAQDRSAHWDSYDYGADILAQPLPEHAVIIGLLGETTLLHYFQQTQGLRPDILALAADDEAARMRAIKEQLAAGRSAYLTRTLPGVDRDYHLAAAGPLIEVRRQPLDSLPPAVTPLNTPVFGALKLAGYELSTPPGHGPLRTVRFTFYWQSAERPDKDYKLSLRLTDSTGAVSASQDQVPVHFAYPTTSWRLGEIVRDAVDVHAPAGTYTPLLIWYDPANGAAEVARLVLPQIQVH